MCSNDESALKRLADAIDRLDASRADADTASLAAQVAAVWSMVTDIDPELARRASRYAQPPDHDHLPLGVVSGAKARDHAGGVRLARLGRAGWDVCVPRGTRCRPSRPASRMRPAGRTRFGGGS
jgi:hypothetical protein